MCVCVHICVNVCVYVLCVVCVCVHICVNVCVYVLCVVCCVCSYMCECVCTLLLWCGVHTVNMNEQIRRKCIEKRDS